MVLLHLGVTEQVHSLGRDSTEFLAKNYICGR